MPKIDELTDALLRAKAEAVYRRKFTDTEWAAKREYRSHPFDVWLAHAVARAALRRGRRRIEAELAIMPAQAPGESADFARGLDAGVALAIEAIDALIRPIEADEPPGDDAK